MGESKVQTSTGFISRRLCVMMLFLEGHGIPFLIANLVLNNVVHLSVDEEEDDEDVDGDEIAVTVTVERLVVVAVDVGRYDTAELDAHIIQSGGYGPRTDVVGVLGCPAHIDGVAVWVREKSGHESECAPFVHHQLWPNCECNDTRESPPCLKTAN